MNDEIIKIHAKNWDRCKGCTQCCTNVSVEMDKPTTKTEYDQIFWLLLHKNVAVYIDHEKDWLVEFETPCEELLSKAFIFYFYCIIIFYHIAKGFIFYYSKIVCIITCIAKWHSN